MNIQKTIYVTGVALGFILSGLVLSGCSSDSTTTPASTANAASTPANYEITLTNLTTAQPIAPAAVVLHTSGYTPVVLGSAASVAIEMLAEGGDNTLVLSEAITHPSVLSSSGGAGVLMPGASEIITSMVSDNAGLKISVAGMLVNTNDGFAAMNGFDISTLAVGESLSVDLPVFDAGTEANSETAATMPGTGGTGFDAARNDVNFVSVHRGVVTADEGLATSGLNQSHRFDNPALQITIRRIS
ncbi:MAG: spondin domain-containing protein [Ghiorsea sp.]